MILGHGVDVVDLKRIKKSYDNFGERFLYKVLSKNELKNIPNETTKIIPFLAKHWAVKEATSKAIGCGLINGSPLHFKDIILDYTWSRMPIIDVSEKLLKITSQMHGILYEKSNIKFHVSTSGDADIVIASVILEQI